MTLTTMKKILYKSYRERFGVPDQIITKNNVDVLIRYPIESEQLFDSGFVTLGISQLPNFKNHIKFEIFLRITCKTNEYNITVDRLMKFALDSLPKQILTEMPFILKNITLINHNPLMNHVLLIWNDSPSSFSVGDEFVKLLKLIPLYEEEANSIKELPTNSIKIIEEQSMINWHNTTRPPSDIIETATKNIWDSIKKWYKEKGSILYKKIEDKSSNESIKKAESKMNLIFPEDLKSSLRISDGFIGFSEYKFLSVDQIHEVWLSMKIITENGNFDTLNINPEHKGVIKNFWWNTKWIPFAEDSAGNKICIDLDNDVYGYSGQIIFWEKNTGPEKSDISSFIDWVNGKLSDLYYGDYSITKEGFLEKN